MTRVLRNDFSMGDCSGYVFDMLMDDLTGFEIVWNLEMLTRLLMGMPMEYWIVASKERKMDHWMDCQCEEMMGKPKVLLMGKRILVDAKKTVMQTK